MRIKNSLTLKTLINNMLEIRLSAIVTSWFFCYFIFTFPSAIARSLDGTRGARCVDTTAIGLSPPEAAIAGGVTKVIPEYVNALPPATAQCQFLSVTCSTLRSTCY